MPFIIDWPATGFLDAATQRELNAHLDELVRRCQTIYVARFAGADLARLRDLQESVDLYVVLLKLWLHSRGVPQQDL